MPEWNNGLLCSTCSAKSRRSLEVEEEEGGGGTVLSSEVEVSSSWWGDSICREASDATW